MSQELFYDQKRYYSSTYKVTLSAAKCGVITPKWRLWTPLWRQKIWSGVNLPKLKNVAFFDEISENV